MALVNAAVLPMALALPANAAAGEPRTAHSSAPTAEAVLAAAFANRYEVDLSSKIELVMRDGSGQERRRIFPIACTR
jgi:hypothetical protein